MRSGVVVLVALMPACKVQHGPIGFWSRNRLDAQEERHGPWRFYFDSNETQLVSRGHYYHGRPRGHWRYYTFEGKLDHDDRYRHGGLMLVRHFHANGQIARRGQARLSSDTVQVQYYWFGIWQLYDDKGRATGWELYDKGYRTAHGLGVSKPDRAAKSNQAPKE
ncbi:hypothetical protein ASU33_01080 [Solirubrum puertoriconensis]|uniref:Uncharacterized protein n=2 Tax=Solirubrum puertoriconensis TaxID=1751427 RepID=A0A9X0HHL1_SOLP1|nr:hypothetical protein ASU33_01080 [Solirubrum puertoriconensis]